MEVATGISGGDLYALRQAELAEKQVILNGFCPRSLRAVSEAPPREKGSMVLMCGGAFDTAT